MTNAEKQKAFRLRQKEAGLKLVRIWVKPEHEQAVKEYAEDLKDGKDCQSL
jgi:hypothetical protein